jgi:uncharacterized phage protein (TIGR01671 family)
MSDKSMARAWTGYRDRNGRGIYEGDIIDIREADSHDEPDAHIVVWGLVTDCCVECETWRVEDDIWQPTIYYRKDDALVIGNRYENPELLPAKADV